MRPPYLGLESPHGRGKRGNLSHLIRNLAIVRGRECLVALVPGCCDCEGICRGQSFFLRDSLEKKGHLLIIATDLSCVWIWVLLVEHLHPWWQYEVPPSPENS